MLRFSQILKGRGGTLPQSPPQHQGLRVNRKERQKQYNKHQRIGQEFYNSGSWRKLRNWFIKTNPLCIECRRQGKVVAAEVVDHIIPVKNGGAKLNHDNLQSLCNLHHAQKTAQDSG